jgi:hypothetical protein
MGAEEMAMELRAQARDILSRTRAFGLHGAGKA